MRAGERGYALMLAIAVVAVLAVAILASAQALSGVASSTSRLVERRNAAVAAESVMTRVAFLMLTRETLSGQLCPGETGCRSGEAITLDGGWREVAGAPDVFVSVQDEAGLFNLNSTDERGLAALLAHGGAGALASDMAATLMDFVDGDDVARRGGAEAGDYSGFGLPAPADAPLVSRWQALDVLGWSDRVDAGAALWGWVAAGPADTALNLNTAPLPVLEAIAGDRRRARAIVTRREVSPIVDLAEAEALLGGESRAASIAIALSPARAFRVQAVFGSQGPLHGIERRLELGVSGAAQPFRWVEERDVRRARFGDGEATGTISLGAARP